MTKKKRSKIRYCFEDYLTTLTEEEKNRYAEKFSPLIAIIRSAADDEEILSRVREYDAHNNSDFFAEAINYKIYCIVCHRVDCVC